MVCGCVISTKVLGFVNVPAPGMVIVTPVPEVSLMDHERRTIWLPPMATEFGAAMKETICGVGHAATLTVMNWSTSHDPLPLTAESR